MDWINLALQVIISISVARHRYRTLQILLENSNNIYKYTWEMKWCNWIIIRKWRITKMSFCIVPQSPPGVVTGLELFIISSQLIFSLNWHPLLLFSSPLADLRKFVLGESVRERRPERVAPRVHRCASVGPWQRVRQVQKYASCHLRPCRAWLLLCPVARHDWQFVWLQGGGTGVSHNVLIQWWVSIHSFCPTDNN